MHKTSSARRNARAEDSRRAEKGAGMVLQQCRARTRRLVVVAAAVAVSAALASGTGLAAGTGPFAGPSAPTAATPTPSVSTLPAVAPSVEPSKPAPPNSSAAAATTSAPATERPAFGVFLDSGVRGVYGMTKFGRWLGGAEPRV